jgi:hypothetical protein
MGNFTDLNSSNVTTIIDIVKYDNGATFGLFIPFTLLTLWAILFGLLFYVDKSKSFAASTFLIFMVSAPFWAAGLLPAWYVVMLLLATAFSIIYLVYTNV